MPYASNAALLSPSCAPYSMPSVLDGVGNLRRGHTPMNSSDDVRWAVGIIACKRHKVCARADDRLDCSVSNEQSVFPHGLHAAVHGTAYRVRANSRRSCWCDCHQCDALAAYYWRNMPGTRHHGHGCASATSVYCRDGSLWLASSCDSLRPAASSLRLSLDTLRNNRCCGFRAGENAAGIPGKRNRVTDVVSVVRWGQRGTLPSLHYGRRGSNRFLPYCVAERIGHRSGIASQVTRYLPTEAKDRAPGSARSWPCELASGDQPLPGITLYSITNYAICNQ
jgi:hypothetical protein